MLIGVKLSLYLYFSTIFEFMKKIIIYPNILISVLHKESSYPNPYINDFVLALSKSNSVKSINGPTKNPLLNILPPRCWGDITIFNWFENIPLYKYGILQTIAAIFYTLALKVTGRKIVYILHNKKPHSHHFAYLSQWMMNFIIKLSNLIITHSNEGLDLIREKYPSAIKKAHFLHHPTKNRLQANEKEKRYNIILWGSIHRYKGIIEFLEYINSEKSFNPSVCIAGHCSDKEVEEEIKHLVNDRITFIPDSLPFEKVGELIKDSEFVLVPYNPETILSSAVLMDSLSFGAKVIGPDVGSFKDYASNSSLKVYTYKTFSDLPNIYKNHKHDEINTGNYTDFLNSNNWDIFVEKLFQLVENK